MFSFRRGLIAVSISGMSSVLLSCAHPSTTFQMVSRDPVADVQNIPQTPDILLNEETNLKGGEKNLLLQKSFNEDLYAIWHRSKIETTADELQSEVLKLKGSYGENLLKRPESWFVSQVENSNWRQIGTVTRTGVILRTTDLRKLPTVLPCFDDPNSPGEGFPFDYLQENQLYLGSPVLVSHFSSDGIWAFVESSVDGHGWIRKSDFGFVSPKEIAQIEKLQIATLTEDNIPIYDVGGQTIDSSRVGNILPLKRKSGGFAYLYLPILRDHQKVTFREGKIDTSHVLVQSLKWVREDIQFAVDKLIGKPYGWGNFLGNRDCSGMIQDFYSLFHILLPPSSAKILNYGKVIDLSQKSAVEKVQIIENEGIPFRTIFYRKGHIGIYAGRWNKQPLMFHTAWGVKTKRGDQDGRNLIGKAVITTLEYGKELPYFNSTSGNFLKEFTKMVILE